MFPGTLTLGTLHLPDKNKVKILLVPYSMDKGAYNTWVSYITTVKLKGGSGKRY